MSVFRKILLSTTCALCSALIGTAQVTVATYSNEFLKIGVGAPALGMSNACVASVSDVTSCFWNPAGLTQIKSNLEVSMMHSEYFGGMSKYDFAAIAARIDSNSYASFSLIRFGVDNIPNTINLVDPNGNFIYDNVTYFSVADYAFYFSYARKAKIAGLRYGANVKVIRRLIGDFGGAWGFGFDVGAQYDYKTWKFGAVLRDATTTFNAWSYNLPATMIAVLQQTNNTLPSNSYEATLPSLIIGANKQFDFARQITLRGEVNAFTTFDGQHNTPLSSGFVTVDPCAGVELGYKGIIFVRLGVGNLQTFTDINGGKYQTVQPSFGIGLRWRNVSLDYALSNFANQELMPYSNIFSFKLAFNRKLK